MISSPGKIFRTVRRIGALLLLAAVVPIHAQERVVVAVIDDGPSDRLLRQQELYIEEMLALTASEFDVQVQRLSGNWTTESIDAVIDSAYADAEVDLVLLTGFVANQVAATRRVFPKPTFLPIILDIGLLDVDPSIGRSGVDNLNYLSAYADFANDLDTLASIVSYRKLILFVDEALSGAIPELRNAALEASTARGIELIEVTHDGIDHDLMRRIPMDADAIMVTALPRMPTARFDQLISEINTAGIPSYSFIGIADVERGLLSTNSEPRDVARQARLNALNMQAVMLGERAEDQPTARQERGRLIINMETARTIGVSPSFAVMSEAVLLNQDETLTGDEYGLVEIARLAIRENQDLRAEQFGVEAGNENIALARSNLLPQLDASTGVTRRKETPTVSAGLFAERSSDAAISLSQLVYSDSASANLVIQRELQRTRMASLDQFRLDVILAATTTYYAVLNARSQVAVEENNLNISRANLQLAEDRVRLGTSTVADVYRWQAEVARAQIRVLRTRAALNQLWDTLNRILHRPQGSRLALREATFNDPFVMTRREFDQLIQNPADYARFSRFYIDRALAQAPELVQLDGQITAKRRELTSQQRAFWLPDFSITGRYTDNFGQSGVGAGPQAGEDLNDWSVGIQATLPLFSGGARRADVSRSRFELLQLEALRTSTEERVEEAIRLELHAAQSAYAQIDLSAEAAEASRLNFEMVSDAYARGTVTIIELLDAQETSLVASAAAAETLYDFFITIMSVQRAVGGYDFLLSQNERDALATEFRNAMTGSRR